MRPLTGLLFAATVLLAGCLDGDAAKSDGAQACATEAVCDGPFLCEADCAPPANLTDPLPVPLTIDVAFAGNIGQRAGACDGNALDRCTPPVERTPYNGGTLVVVNGTLLGGAFTLSWTPESQLTTELGFGAMTMTPDCDGECHAASLGEVTGTSPLALSLPAAEFVLQEREVLHLYVYPTQGSVYQNDVYAYAWAGQAFNLDGNVTYQPWTPAVDV